MDTNFENSHRQKAIDAFREAIQTAEKRLAKTQSSDSIDTAKVLIELAEFHLLSNETAKAEEELTKALDFFYGCANEDVKVCIAYVVYILKTLSGMHVCMGRRKEAKTEEKEALIWEEKLNKLYTLNSEQTTRPHLVSHAVTVLNTDFIGTTFA